ncbi:MAG TPA: hypothetical protein VH599_06950 [Ktedonobacterales bacterium]|jgi:hypothetical protein
MGYVAQKLARGFCLIGLFLLPLVIGACAPYQSGNATAANATGTASANKADCKQWSKVANPVLPGKQNQFNAVAAVSAQNIWVVGSGASTHQDQALIEHWNGTRWSVVVNPEVGSVALNGIAALSAKDIWAVGSASAQPFIEHWNGSAWQVVQSASVPGTQSTLSAVAALSAANAWAVGHFFASQDSPSHALIEHWDGKSWSIVQNPDLGALSSDLESIAASSASDIWAVGSSAPDKGFSSNLIEHWDGKSWKVVQSPNPGDFSDSLSAVAAVSASDAWAVGEYAARNTPGAVLLAEHWDGKTWSVASIGGPEAKLSWLEGLAVLSSDDVWAVGDYKDYNTRLTQAFAEHWDGSQWNLDFHPPTYRDPDNGDDHIVNAVAAADARSIWAVGTLVNPNNGSQPPIGDSNSKAVAQPLTLFRCP